MLITSAAREIVQAIAELFAQEGKISPFFGSRMDKFFVSFDNLFDKPIKI